MITSHEHDVIFNENNEEEYVVTDKKKPAETSDEAVLNNGQADDSNPVAARRKILRTIVTGGGLGATAAFVPTTWTKPVVDAVTLPAHAQTSGGPFNGTGVVGVGPPIMQAPDEGDFGSFVQAVRDVIIPTAEAQGGRPFGRCLTITVGNLADNGSTASVVLTSGVFGDDPGVGTFGQLRGAGITTANNHVVIASSLNPNGTGAGTVDGVPFYLTPGSCAPIDGEGIENGGSFSA